MTTEMAERIPYSATRETITAEIAMQWLETAAQNRAVMEVTVASYAADMIAGKWPFNGEAIKFDWHGHLIDGQHRLWALIMAADMGHHLEIEMLVLRGLDPADQLSMDQGRRRAAGQQLELLGNSNGMYLAAIARAVQAYDTEAMWKNGRAMQMSTSAVAAWVEEHRAEADLANEHIARIRKIPAAPRISGAMLILFHRQNPAAALEFFDYMYTGANLPDGSPILALRERFAKAKQNREKLTDRDTMGFYIQVWNAWRRGAATYRVQRPKGDEWAKHHFHIAA